MKNCAFQFACNSSLLKNTGLISEEEANDLWESYIPVFIKHLENGDEPEMVIWTEMRNELDYGKTKKHINHEDTTLVDGVLYQLVPVS